SQVAGGVAGRVGQGTDGAAPQPDQPTRRPNQDVQVQEEAPRTPRHQTLEEDLRRGHRPAADRSGGSGIETCDSRNGIGPKPSGLFDLCCGQCQPCRSPLARSTWVVVSDAAEPPT